MTHDLAVTSESTDDDADNDTNTSENLSHPRKRQGIQTVNACPVKT